MMTKRQGVFDYPHVEEGEKTMRKTSLAVNGEISGPCADAPTQSSLVYGSGKERARTMGKIIALPVLAIWLVTISPNMVHAFDFVLEGKITLLEASYLPNWIFFQMDTGAGPCPAGTWLRWDGTFHGVDQERNVTSVYSTLLAAFLSGRSIRFHGFNADCKGAFVHLLPS